jgi:hypothetical protein
MHLGQDQIWSSGRYIVEKNHADNLFSFFNGFFNSLLEPVARDQIGGRFFSPPDEEPMMSKNNG